MKPHDSIDRLIQATMHGGEMAFDVVPKLLCRVIEERQWADRLDKDGNSFRSFEEFVTHRRWQGLESSIDDLCAYCRKHPEVERLILAEVGPIAAHGEIGGGHSRPDNVRSDRYGNASTYTLKRLKRDAPELAAKVAAGEMSANAAAIEAGFRKRTFSIPDDVDAAADVLVKRFDLDHLISALLARKHGAAA